MKRNEYNQKSLRRLRKIVSDSDFMRSQYQIRAQANAVEYGDPSAIDTKYDARKVWNTCNYVLTTYAKLVSSAEIEDFELAYRIRRCGETLEFLSQIEDGIESDLSLLGSALCYEIVGMKANATCLARKLDERVEGNHPLRKRKLESLFLDSLIALLASDISRIENSAAEISELVDSFQDSLQDQRIDDISLRSIEEKTGFAYVSEFASNYAQYCLSGDEQSIRESIDAIRQSNTNFSEVGHYRIEAITTQVETALEKFYERSTWQNIRSASEELGQSKTWQFYLRNLAYDNSITEFWPSQLEAIDKGVLTSEDSFLVQMPTSAGKTLIAELSILAALTQRDQAKCLYIAPYRALSAEVRDKLAGRLGDVGFKVADLVGGFEYDSFEDYLLDETDVLVATPEKIDLLLRTQRRFFESVSNIVVDEGHLVGDAAKLGESLERPTLGRGAQLEFLIARLRRLISNPRFLFLSAVMPEINALEFSNWLSRDGHGAEPISIGDEGRPARLVLTKFEWVSEENGELEFVGLEELPSGRKPFVPYFLKREQLETGQPTPTGKTQRRSWPKSMDNKVQTTAMVASKFAQSGPVLIFTSEKRQIDWLANNLKELLTWLGASDKSPTDRLSFSENPDLDSYRIAREWLGDDHLLSKSLRYGVGVHHGDLPDPVRNAVEYDYKEERINILISTSTLGQGVNLPIKTVIFYETKVRYEKDGRYVTDKISVRDFWNICGRAGRANKETEGKAVFICQNDKDKERLKYYMESDYEPVVSELYDILTYILDRRVESRELLNYFDSTMLSLIAEELVDTDNLDEIESLIGESLVGIQAARNDLDLTPLTSLMRKNAKYIAKRVPNGVKRRVFASTGMRVSTCEQMEAAVSDYVRALNGEIPNRLVDSEKCDYDLLSTAFQASEGVKELSETRQGLSVDNEYALVESWVSGDRISEIRKDYNLSSQSNNLSIYISNFLKYSLPWFVNGFVSVFAYSLSDNPGDLEIGEMREGLPQAWQHLASFVKYGVETLPACWACSLGVESRQTAREIAELYQDDRGQLSMKPDLNFPDFTSWFSRLSNSAIKGLDAYSYRTRQLYDVRNSITGSRERRQFVQAGGTQLICSVVGMAEFDSSDLVSNLNIGEQLQLDRNPNEFTDSDALVVVARGQRVGYLDRNNAQILLMEMDVGRNIKAVVEGVHDPLPFESFPSLEVRVELEPPTFMS